MTRTQCALGMLTLILAACASGTRVATEAPPLGSDEVVIGERITFTGVDGNPVVPVPAVYRVQAVGDDRLALYHGGAKTPLLVQASKRTLESTESLRSLPGPRAVLDVEPKGGASRNLWLVRPDGTAHEALGSIEGVRTRGWLTDPRTLARFATPVVTEPRSNALYWNRFVGLRVLWSDADSVQIHLVHRVTRRVVRTTLGVAQETRVGYRGTAWLTDMHHLDPGDYDLYVSSMSMGGRVSVPIRIAGRCRSLSAGWTHNLALAPDPDSGSAERYVWAFGSNGSGQCGPRATGAKTPMRRTGVAAVAVAAGVQHSLALNAAGEVITWGGNASGQLGRRTKTESDSQPVAIPKPREFTGQIVAIAAGNLHSLALDAAGGVWAWGANDKGQCGQGESTAASFVEPVRVRQVDGNPLSGVVVIAAGTYHNVVLKSDGSVWAWGGNEAAQLEETLSEIVWTARPIRSAWTSQVSIRDVDAGKWTSVAMHVQSDGSLALARWGKDMPRESTFLQPETVMFTHTDQGILLRQANPYDITSSGAMAPTPSLSSLPLPVLAIGKGLLHRIVVSWEVGDSVVPVVFASGRSDSYQCGVDAFTSGGWVKTYFRE
ncbi:MAG: RCC1 domain-containing protein [Planctomycetota bacterium]